VQRQNRDAIIQHVKGNHSHGL